MRNKKKSLAPTKNEQSKAKQAKKSTSNQKPKGVFISEQQLNELKENIQTLKDLLNPQQLFLYTCTISNLLVEVSKHSTISGFEVSDVLPEIAYNHDSISASLLVANDLEHIIYNIGGDVLNNSNSSKKYINLDLGPLERAVQKNATTEYIELQKLYNESMNTDPNSPGIEIIKEKMSNLEPLLG